MVRRRRHARHIELVPLEFLLSLIWPKLATMAENRQYRKKAIARARAEEMRTWRS